MLLPALLSLLAALGSDEMARGAEIRVVSIAWIREAIERGLTDEEIAEALGLSSLRLVLLEHRNPARQLDDRLEQRAAQIEDLFERGFSDRGIAKTLGITRHEAIKERAALGLLLKKEVLVLDLFNLGFSDKKIADRIASTKQSIVTVRSQIGLLVRNRDTYAAQQRLERLNEMYRQGVSAEAVSQEIDISLETARLLVPPPVAPFDEYAESRRHQALLRSSRDSPLRAARKAAGLTQPKLAERAGVGQASVSRAETGGKISDEALEKLWRVVNQDR